MDVIKPNIVLDKELELIYINFCEDLNLTGSAFFQTLSSVGNNVAETKSADEIKKYLQNYSGTNIIKKYFLWS